MAMVPERSKPLHNFNLPNLKWGTQRFLKCIKVNNGNTATTTTTNSNNNPSPSHHRSSDDRIRRRSYHQHHHQQQEVYANGPTKNSRDSGSTDVTGGVGFKRKFLDDDAVGDGGGEGIAEVREKVMYDLQTAADKMMKDAIFKDAAPDDDGDGYYGGGDEVSPGKSQSPAVVESVRPWNLRKRRAAAANGFGSASSQGGAGVGTAAKVLRVEAMRQQHPALSASSMKVASASVAENSKSPRLRSGGAVLVAASPSGEKKERAKFSVPLSKKEIEEDIMALVGHRPARRPKKRAKAVQKQLDTLFPGLWLSEITPDIYRVHENQ